MNRSAPADNSTSPSTHPRISRVNDHLIVDFQAYSMGVCANGVLDRRCPDPHASDLEIFPTYVLFIIDPKPGISPTTRKQQIHRRRYAVFMAFRPNDVQRLPPSCCDFCFPDEKWHACEMVTMQVAQYNQIDRLRINSKSLETTER